MPVVINGNGTITGSTPTTISGSLSADKMPSGSIIQVQHVKDTAVDNPIVVAPLRSFIPP